MMQKVSLHNLAKRIEMDERLLESAPEEEVETIQKHLYKELLLVVNCIEDNIDNPLLCEIYCKNDGVDTKAFLEKYGDEGKKKEMLNEILETKKKDEVK
jgi:hypothetical protein